MIHINKGDDPHEWTDDFQTESAKDDTLQQERIKKRIKLRTVSERMGLSFSDVSRIERGLNTDPEMVKKFKEALA